MNFTHYTLGQRSRGQIVEVTLKGNAANVRLMDSGNFHNFKSGRRHNYYGGHFKQSPARIPVPRNGTWHLTVDLGGYSGRVQSSVQVLPGPLPDARQQSLSSVPSLVRDVADVGADTETYDVFISHASEDKNDIVRPLAEALRLLGLRVWYDEFELKIGDSLRRKIDYGIATSRFGIVVLSQSFLTKGWTNYELDGLVTRFVTGEQVLLPIWHNITKAEVIKYSPSLADKLARNTATHTVEEIAQEICDVIRS